MGHGYQNDFYFDYGHDVIEEVALNEKYCKQVLRILIGKADTDIVELEEELGILRHQLAWADEEWSELCSAFLTEKISCLDILIQNLKNKEDDIGNCSQMHWEPVKRIDDIVKALFSDYFRQKNEQLVDVITKESSSDLLREKEPVNLSASDANIKEMAKDINVTSEQNHTISRMHLKSRGRNADTLETVKGRTMQKRKLSYFQSKSSRTTEANMHIMTCRDNSSTQNPFLPIQVKRRHHQKMNKCQNEQSSNILVQNPNPDAKKLTIRHLKEERKSMSPELEVHIENVMREGLNTSRPTVELSLKPENKRESVDENKPDHAVVEDSFARCATLTYKEKLQLKIELEAIQNEANAALELRLMETALLEKVEPADTSLNSSEAFKEVSKETIKSQQSTGSDVASEKRDESNSFLGNRKKRTKPPGRVNVSGTPDKRKSTSKSDPTKQQRQQLNQVRKADVTSEDKWSDSHLSCKQGSCLRKETSQLNPEGVQEPSLSVELGLSSSSTEKYKFLLSRKIKKAKARSDLCDSGELISPSQQRRKGSSSSLGLLEGNKELKSLEVSLVKSHGDSNDRTPEEYLATESHFVGCSSSSKLTMIDLKAIAKELQLKGYSKLRKLELARLLGITCHIRGGRNGNGTSFANEADPLIFSS